MEQVWKCDFCETNDVQSEKILDHEKNCDFNPILKKCPSCKFLVVGRDGGFPGCKIHMNIMMGHYYPNCAGWQIGNVKLYRKLKLKRLEKNETSMEM